MKTTAVLLALVLKCAMQLASQPPSTVPPPTRLVKRKGGSAHGHIEPVKFGPVVNIGKLGAGGEPKIGPAFDVEAKGLDPSAASLRAVNSDAEPPKLSPQRGTFNTEDQELTDQRLQAANRAGHRLWPAAIAGVGAIQGTRMGLYWSVMKTREGTNQKEKVVTIGPLLQSGSADSKALIDTKGWQTEVTARRTREAAQPSMSP